MIAKLRNRMILVSGSVLAVVFFVIFVAIYIAGTRQLNDTMDMLTDRISAGNGRFLPFDSDNPRPPDMDSFPGIFTEETPFSTRFFAVWFDAEGNIAGENTASVSAITAEEARSYAEAARKRDNERGWYGAYRYKFINTNRGSTAVFVDGSMNRALTGRLFLVSGAVLLGSMLVILLIILLVSGRAVRPIAESYEKQNQFITDANHELKTPLTLIMTNLEILEAEVGENEWLDDIRSESRRMSALVNQLTILSRLDEEQPEMLSSDFSLSDMVGDTVSEFIPLAKKKELVLRTDIEPELYYRGDEGSLRRALAILLDNAVKYCDEGGDIYVSVGGRRKITLCVENSFKDVDGLELGRLFDRFYREDKARTASGSFGIGLSIARSTAARHRGEISAYKAGAGRIGFKLILK